MICLLIETFIPFFFFCISEGPIRRKKLHSNSNSDDLILSIINNLQEVNY